MPQLSQRYIPSEESMFQPSLASIWCFCLICISFAAQAINAQDNTWRKYNLQAIEIPPPNVVSNNLSVEKLSVELPKSDWRTKLLQRGAPPQRKITTISTKNTLSVYGTADIQQHIAENIAHLQRPEAKNVRFVMEINYLTQAYNTNNLEQVLWQENQYGLLTIGTGTGYIPHPTIAGIESPIHPYLHPITVQPTLGPSKTSFSGINFYWVAKEDIPKMQEAWHKHVHHLKGGSRFRHHFQGQPVMTSNAQQGILADVSFPFTLSEKKWYMSSSASTKIPAPYVFASVSVISLDGQTVSSDIDIHFPQFPKLAFIQSAQASLPFPVKTAKGSTMEYLTMSEEDLIWPADGMLVVFMDSIPFVADGEIEKKGTGLPFVNRKRVYTLGGHEEHTLTGMLTIRLVSPHML